MARYYELEKPIVIKSEKNVVRIYVEHGKVQVFPRVESSKHGIGRGATIDLQAMTLEEINELRDVFNQSINVQMEKRN